MFQIRQFAAIRVSLTAESSSPLMELTRLSAASPDPGPGSAREMWLCSGVRQVRSTLNTQHQLLSSIKIIRPREAGAACNDCNAGRITSSGESSVRGK